MSKCLNCPDFKNTLTTSALLPYFYEPKAEHGVLLDSETSTLFIYCYTAEIAEQAEQNRLMLAVRASGLGAKEVVVLVGKEEGKAEEFLRFTPETTIEYFDRAQKLTSENLNSLGQA